MRRRGPADDQAGPQCPDRCGADRPTSRDSARPRDRPGARWCRASATTPLPRAERWGSPFFCDHRLQRLDIQRLLRDDLLQPTILVLELLEPLHLAQFHAAELRFPAIVRLLGDAMRPTQIGDL